MALIATGLASCGGRRTAFVSLPDDLPAEARGFIFAVDDSVNVLQIFASGSELKTAALSVELPDRYDSLEGLRLSLLLYTDSGLADLGLEPGPVPRMESRRCEILEPSSVFESSGGAMWTQAEALRLDGPIAQYLVDDAEHCWCSRFEPTRLQTPLRADVNQLLEIGPSRALGMDRKGGVWVLTPTSAAELRAPGVVRSMSYRGGELWLGSAVGKVYRGPLSGPYPEVLSGATVESVKILVTSPPDSALEAYVGFLEDIADQREQLRIMRLSDSEETIFDEEVNEAGRPELGAVWRRPGEVGFSIGAPDVLFYENSAVRRSRVSDFAAGEGLMLFNISALAFDENLGWLAGGQTGKVFRSVDGGHTWNELLDEQGRAQIRGLIPLADSEGFVVVDQAGTLSQYHPKVGFCPDFSVEWAIEAAIGVGGSVVVGGQGGPPSPVFWLRPVARN